MSCIINTFDLRAIRLLFFGLIILTTPCSCIINNPKPEECVVEEVTITDVKEGSSFDIVFYASNGDRYYINRGLEQGLALNSIKKIAINQKATLHLPKFAVGVSEHIAQLTIADSIIYTEFD